MVVGIQGLSFGVSSFGFGQRGISSEHFMIVQKLVSLGIVPTYNYERDLDKLSQALGAMVEGGAKTSNTDEVEDLEESVDLSPMGQSQSILNTYIPFSSELNQSAMMNKFLFGL